MSLELDLYEIKWFDYRMLSPNMATMFFVREYAKAIGNLRVKLGLLDGKNVSYYIALPEFDVRAPEMWKYWKRMNGLRQWADKNFMRYNDFWEWACRAYIELGFNERRMRFQKRKGGKPVLTKKGKPSYENKYVIFLNSFLNKNLLAKVLDLQLDHERYVLYSDMEIFRAENWQDHPIQNDYYDHLASEVKRKHPDPWTRIDRLCAERRMSKGYVKKYLESSGFMGKRAA